MAVENTRFGWGLGRYPLGTATGNSLLVDADPGLKLVMEFCIAVIRAYAGARWTEAWAAARPTAPAVDIIAQVVPFDPTDVLKQDQFKFPLLCVFREKTKYQDVTVEMEHGDTRLIVAWCLPPLIPSERELLLPMRYAVEQCLRERFTMGHDASYASDAPVFDGVFECVGVADAMYGNVPGAQGVNFPSVVIGFDMIEQQERPYDATQFDLLEGADVAIDLFPNDGTNPIQDFQDFKTDVGEFDSAFSTEFTAAFDTAGPVG